MPSIQNAYMTTLSSLTALSPVTITPAAAITNSVLLSASGAAADEADASTVVVIPWASVEAPMVYTPQGTLAGAAPVVTWAQSHSDAVSLTMAGNFTSSTMSGRFNNLGSALLNRFKTTADNWSQTVETGGPGGPSGQGDIKLTVKTASGVTVDIEMDSKGGKLSVNLHSSASLSDDERNALAALANGFQQAIDGLSAVPPRLDLDGLTQYDPSVLSSVNMQFKVTDTGSGDDISADISLDSSTKSVKVTSSLGTIDLSVDTSNAAIRGSDAQRQQAITSYLSQFDQANAKGHGNAALMSMFKDAFTQLNSADGASSQPLPGTADLPWIAQSEQAMLTGLADFTGSITDVPVSSNPLMPQQTDTFSYQASQRTKTEGDLFNGKVTQTRQSELHASYHQSLSGGPIVLGPKRATQNYEYVQIEDAASSTASIETKRGQILQATLDQTASQSTRQSRYVRGNLVSDVTTPTNTSKSQDLLALLKPLLDNGDAQHDSHAWEVALSSIHAMVLSNAQ